MGFGQLPFGILSDRQWYWPYFFVDQNFPDQIGKPLPSPNEGIRHAELYRDDNYPDRDYYQWAAGKPEDFWLEPYRWYVLTLTTYNGPIRDENQKIIGLYQFSKL